MFRVISPQSIINNITVLSAPYLENKDGIEASKLKQAYRDFLSNLQPHCPYVQNEDLFHASDEITEKFEDYFLDETLEFLDPSLIVDLNNLLYPDPIKRKDALEKALQDFEKQDPTFIQLFKLVVNTVFCNTSKKLGGTSVNPRYIGVICAYYDMNAEPSAIPEILTHEFTHHALFLDELRYKHYDYELLRKPEALLNIFYKNTDYKISLHRCMHSLFVAAEILLLRDNFLGHVPKKINQHTPSEPMLKRARLYLQAIKDNPLSVQAMSERCHQLFLILDDFYSKYRIPQTSAFSP